MKPKIITDSGCDLNNKIQERLQISKAPLTLYVGDKEFRDQNLDVQEYINYMKACEDPPKSASPSPYDFQELYKTSEGNTFVITLSSKISSTYNSAVIAKDMISDNSGKFIHVFDSLSASVGEALVALKISELIKEKINTTQIIEKVNKYIKEMNTLFLLDSLDNLVKSGRLSKISGKIATVLSIKPIMGASEEGEIILFEKIRGSKKALNRLVEMIGEYSKECENRILGIAHCNALDKAEKIKLEAKKRYNFKDIIIVEMGALISTYADEGGVLIAF